MYATRRTAQGSISSSADFPVALQHVLAPMLEKCALVYIDDVLLFARDAEGVVDANASSTRSSRRPTSERATKEWRTAPAKQWQACPAGWVGGVAAFLLPRPTRKDHGGGGACT